MLEIQSPPLPNAIMGKKISLHNGSFMCYHLFAQMLGLEYRQTERTMTAQAFNAVISRMVTAVLWTSPLGIASLIAAAICRACSLLGPLGALAAWLATVLSGLAIFGGLVLPVVFWVFSRKRPTAVLAGFSRALVLAFGTSSSSAALPVRFLPQHVCIF